MVNLNVVIGPACSILMSFPVSVPSWSILVSLSRPMVNFNVVFGPGWSILMSFPGSFPVWSILVSFSRPNGQF